jgi:hypothetical protein
MAVVHHLSHAACDAISVLIAEQPGPKIQKSDAKGCSMVIGATSCADAEVDLKFDPSDCAAPP